MRRIGDYYTNRFALERGTEEENRCVAKGFNYARLGDDEDKYPSAIAGSKLVEFSISWSHRN